LVVSLAVPVKDGVVLLDGVSGWFRVTVGGAVLTVKVTGALVPVGLPRSELSWVATAVYSPLDSVGLAAPEVQLPPAWLAVAVATIGPSGFAPE